ncbi:thyrotroph embryonic factor-like [Ptychodera flava]|uniref:thyrotroph embryonic factor-like n=1 Tax=Ptychodera flava TaxID=63121 RepID=UPI00396A3AFD
MATSPANKYGVTLKSLLENPNLLQPPRSLSSSNKFSDKQKELEEWNNKTQMSADMSAAFLGPTLWDKTLTYDGNDFKLEYMDLDEFLSENGIPLSGEDLPASERNLPPKDAAPVEPTLMQHRNAVRSQEESNNSTDQQKPNETVQLSPSASPIREPSPVNVAVDFDLSPTDVALATVPGQDSFDPRRHSFSEDDLKPQPMIKKSRKVFIPEELKDDKYWERRKKNNIAAKRSRDARRVKENQIAIKASFLSKENVALKSEVTGLKKEVISLKKVIANYEKKLQMLNEKLGEQTTISS